MEKNKKTAFEIVMENRKEVVDELIKSMEEGYVATRQLWDKMAVRPQNPVSQIYYRGGNRFRLSMAAVKNGYKDPRWLTYNQAAEMVVEYISLLLKVFLLLPIFLMYF